MIALSDEAREAQIYTWLFRTNLFPLRSQTRMNDFRVDAIRIDTRHLRLGPG